MTAPIVPAGYVLVPTEPTPEMCRALFVCLCRADEEAATIKAVLRAAPATPLPAAPVQGPTSEQIQKHPSFGIFLSALGALAICNMDEARDIAQRMRDALDIQPPPIGENE